jgi:hypothetical protein
MKKPSLIAAAVLMLGLLIWLSLRSVPPSNHAPNVLPATQHEVVSPPPTKASLNHGDAEDIALEAAQDAKRERERQQRIDQEVRDYNTPIVFYGLVLDQFDKPAAQARVEYACVGGSFDGDRELLADAQGRFTIRDVRGKHLRVRATHPNYYNADLGSGYYYYAGTDHSPLHVPESANPVIFRLLKKGEAAELVRREDRVRFDGDEPERSFSFYDHSRRRDQADYVILRRVETPERDNQGKPIRRLEMEVKGGGIQQRTDPFAFTAPGSGYQSKLYFMRPLMGGALDYFVRFSNGNYGRFTIMGSAGDYLIESYLNPDRSPNLEYDPEKEVTFIETGKPGIDLLYPASDKPLPATPQPTPVERQRKTLRDQRLEDRPPPRK